MSKTDFEFDASNLFEWDAQFGSKSWIQPSFLHFAKAQLAQKT